MRLLSEARFFFLFFFIVQLATILCLMFSRTSSFTVLSRGCRYLLRPTVHSSPFSLSARSFAAVDAAMADTSGVTADSLKSKLLEQLQAQHVEIEDLSGESKLGLHAFGLWSLCRNIPN